MRSDSAAGFDEEPPKEFLDEQIPRLLSEDGDLIITLTPVRHMTYTYDEIFERAKIRYRTKTVSDFTGLPMIEKTDSPLDIAVIQAATDDNPTLSTEVIDRMFSHFDDPDDVAIRRYGVFKQVSGRIFKAYEPMVHMISAEKYALEEIPHDWVHGRFVDYHQHTPWAIVWMAISHQDEAFIYQEFNPSPEQMVTKEITSFMASMSKDYSFRINLMDPLAQVTQTTTGLSVMDDFNRLFFEYKREGTCTGGYWESWDSKSTRGRDEIRKRLKNSKLCGKPFNNKTTRNGKDEYLPTLWILSNCKRTAKSFKQWRLEEWAMQSAKVTKDQKEVPQQKWSHFCTAVEAAFKDSRFRKPAVIYGMQREAPEYFRARR